MGFVDDFHNKYQTGGLQHLTAAQVRREVELERFNAYWRFTIVRNPFDRLVSQYASMPRRPDLCAFIGLRAEADFTSYLHAISGRLHVQWLAQTAFVHDANGASLVETIYRYEDFAAAGSAILARLGLDRARLPHANRGERGRYQDYYGAAERRFVAELFAEDLARFDYRF